MLGGLTTRVTTENNFYRNEDIRPSQSPGFVYPLPDAFIFQ